MDDADRLAKLKFLTLDQAKDIILRCHKILDRAEILGAERAPCDDPDCTSHLTHRLHDLVSRVSQYSGGTDR